MNETKNRDMAQAYSQVEEGRDEIVKALEQIQTSFHQTAQKLAPILSANRKFPGLLWLLTGAIGTTLMIDFFTNRIDSKPTRGYNPTSNSGESDRA
jgi:hypothetical protein